MHTPDSEGYIPFIHNYCDRRCERCRFVRQCRVGAVEVDDVGEDDDVVGDERVEDLHDRMKKLLGLSDEDMAAMEEVRKEHEDEPVDPLEEAREEAAMAEWQRQQEERDRQVDAQPLSVMGSTYLDLVRAWNRPREASFMARGVQLHPRMGMGIPNPTYDGRVLIDDRAITAIVAYSATGQRVAIATDRTAQGWRCELPPQAGSYLLRITTAEDDRIVRVVRADH